MEVLRAKAFPLVKLARPHEADDQIQRLQFLRTEILRLFRTPDLFPSPATKAKFAAILALDANLQFLQAVKELLLRDTVADIDFYIHHITRRTYLFGSKGWENFFLNMAPGAPLRRERIRTSPKSSYQIIPISGMRIIGDAIRQEQGLARWITQTTIPLKEMAARTTRLIDLDKPDEQQLIPSLPLSHQSYSLNLRPNPYREDQKPRLDLSKYGPERLESYSPLIGRVEMHPILVPIAALNATNMFPMISIRAWHPPTRIEALRYQHFARQSPQRHGGTAMNGAASGAIEVA
ncbi:uncharacterized protein Z519_12108 [Cladophialophora bantiana CBS 173.52]|uniref:Uncharacterized protein n=1 Tax=Cladophialophora bantiana (strain ATCC 10958 / CBS 173.52 / CDC B-1940 / NIH 8579) TaxID=1442370 RepID=A0A0D2EAP0_CLAB1|nr:uncharacterized protein Z519_12108 [Cladophialophora bantiana CBS 173.52]KIW87206.1 hypothetical protein Z519_12108 [Cladophialophora bantiana CBS 173.52]